MENFSKDKRTAFIYLIETQQHVWNFNLVFLCIVLHFNQCYETISFVIHALY